MNQPGFNQVHGPSKGFEKFVSDFLGGTCPPRCHIVVPLFCLGFTWLVPAARMNDQSAFAEPLGKGTERTVL